MVAKCALIGAPCPKRNRPGEGRREQTYCPNWAEGLVEQDGKGGERIVADCAMRRLPEWLGLSVRLTEINAAELSSMRSGVVRAVESVGQRLVENTQLPEDYRTLLEGSKPLEAPDAGS